MGSLIIPKIDVTLSMCAELKRKSRNFKNKGVRPRIMKMEHKIYMFINI